MAEIKSALEKALERAEKMGRATEEELKENIYLDNGKRLAARYLREEEMELANMLEQEPSGTQPYVLKGVEEILQRNIVLPRDEDLERNSKKAMRGMLTLKKNNIQARKILAQIEQVFEQYKRTVSDTREKLKARFSMKLGELQKQIEQQLHSKVKINVEQQPRFQEEWLQISVEINAQFNHFLKQQKELLKST